jgi:hypothetical protein
LNAFKLRADVADDLLGLLDVVDGVANTDDAGDGSPLDADGGSGDAERIHHLAWGSVRYQEACG